MTDQPKKTISLRKFRGSIADLDEVVDVSLRDPHGNIRILGYWTPYMTAAPGAKTITEVQLLSVGLVKDPLPGHEFHLVQTPEEAAAAVPPVRPFSKEAQAGRKKK